MTANPSLSGNEANLTSLTVGATSYKVGTSINALSYSDTSKLLLSYPFSLASDQAGTSTNYGSLTPSSTNNTAVYESNVGLRFTSDAADNNDIFNVTIPTGLTSSFTAYVKYKQAQVPSGNENEYERYPAVLYLSDNQGRPSILACYDTGTKGGNSNFVTQIKDGTTTVTNNNFSGSYDRWYHLFIVVDRNAGKVKTYVDSTTSGVLATDDPVDVSDNLDGIDNFLLAGRFDGSAPADRNLDGDFAAFHVFNHAMTLCDAQDWVDYVDLDTDTWLRQPGLACQSGLLGQRVVGDPLGRTGACVQWVDLAVAAGSCLLGGHSYCKRDQQCAYTSRQFNKLRASEYRQHDFSIHTYRKSC